MNQSPAPIGLGSGSIRGSTAVFRFTAASFLRITTGRMKLQNRDAEVDPKGVRNLSNSFEGGRNEPRHGNARRLQRMRRGETGGWKRRLNFSPPQRGRPLWRN